LGGAVRRCDQETVALAAMLYLGKRQLVNSIAQSAPGRFFTVWWFHAWGFDWLYHNVFVRPYLWIARLLQRDPLNSLMNTPAILSRWSNRGLTVSENGQVRWYVASMGLGAVVVLALLLFV
ncbi:NADH-quinone oxidoreductase subunit L, partial [Yersinia enterocolitica]|nr:NADH-quinone oxidoreductase subunit L [Yersinia enterocolitica]